MSKKSCWGFLDIDDQSTCTFMYCMLRKSWLNLCNKLLYSMGHDFLDIQYTDFLIRICGYNFFLYENSFNWNFRYVVDLSWKCRLQCYGYLTTLPFSLIGWFPLSQSIRWTTPKLWLLEFLSSLFFTRLSIVMKNPWSFIVINCHQGYIFYMQT